jgi:HJR/Mrr/RecB family endonuclease
VQEVLAAKGFYAAQRAVVLTNNSYSNSARALAAANGVELLDRNDLAKMLGRAAG